MYGTPQQNAVLGVRDILVGSGTASIGMEV